MRRRRAIWVGLGILALSILVAAWGWLSLGATPSEAAATATMEPVLVPLPPLPPAPAELEDESLRVISVEGGVERKRADERWAAVSVGDDLRADEAIRTGENSRAVLGLRSTGKVEIAQRSEFTVKEISRTMARIRLEQGRLSADLAEGGGPLRIEDRGGGISAEASTGKFVVLSGGEGQMVAAAIEGKVRLSAGASSVVINPGEQSEASRGAAPSAPHAIPGSLFLKIARPTAAVQRELSAKLRGETAPGAVISVNGLFVPTSQDGEFEVDVPLRDGRNELVVGAEDVFGRTERVRLPPITVKTQVGDVKAKVIWTGGSE